MGSLKTFSRIFLLLFFLVVILDILAIINDSVFWQTLSKPLIIPSLAAYYLSQSKSRNRWYVMALFFSFLGDVLLLDKTNLFLFGIASFLITQLVYIYIFSKGLLISSKSDKFKALAPFLLFFMVLITVLAPGLKNFLIPVVVYGIAISLFGSVSLLKHLVERDKASQLLLAGAVLFIISDSLIALNKFHEPQVYYPVAIMLTYSIAQYLIAAHMLLSERNTHQDG